MIPSAVEVTFGCHTHVSVANFEYCSTLVSMYTQT